MNIQRSAADFVETEVHHDGRTFRLVHADASDHIFRIAQTTGTFYEIEFLEALRAHLEVDDYVVDVGANIGNHSLFFAGVCGCRVIAIEPNPLACALLREMVRRNGLADRIEIKQVGVGQVSSRARTVLDASKHNLGMSLLEETADGSIQVEPLDSLVSTDVTPRLVKIDTEGMELAVLHGAEGMIARTNALLCLELTTMPDFEAVYALLAPKGYVPLGAFNYSPTHVFGLLAKEPPEAILAAVARQSSRNYIQSFERFETARAQEVDLAAQLDTVKQRLQEAENRLARAEALLRSTDTGGQRSQAARLWDRITGSHLRA